MNTHVAPPPGKLTAEEFLDFIEGRPREERWQLIDGEAFVMMSPATHPHQMISRNLARLLDNALEQHRPELAALHEFGIRSDEHPDFLAVADVAVVVGQVENEVYGSRFFLAAEILSDSNTREAISHKRIVYAASPDCLHVLIVSQKDFAVEVWSRSNDWQGRVFRSPDDLIELSEFGFSCRVADLYRGTPVK
ncbi:Uma2 family endonuclease [Aquibium carbonis]|uniref:Uma2 family endonuclease n=1 Tax=Aquibium carbonis TaxID=2495581 RepID=A0A429YUZ4_9HYPH|nr:Uma2 family endonuclease [Aquibium carbonis]RST85252.1 Uma2 family endonuclease [Aquibium carbonis]